MAGTLGGNGPLREDCRAPEGGGGPEIRAARRSAVRQRTDPSRHRAEQDSERSGGQVAVDGRLRRAVRAWLRLSWPADRVEGRSRTRTEEARDVHRRFPA